MRKTWKRALSLVLSAALVVTAGAFGTVQGDKSVKAADDINFTAQIESYGCLWNDGWKGPTSPVSSDAWKVNVTEVGKDYTLKATAPTDAELSGAFIVNTDLTSVPKNFKLVGKTVKIGSQTYDWSKTESYLDGTNVRLSVWNEWGKDEEGKLSYQGNILGEETKNISIKKGDELELTFSVVEVTPLFTAFFASYGTIWGWTGDDLGRIATPGAWEVVVTEDGDYTVKTEATNDCSSSDAAFVVETDLKALPTDYDIVAKTVKVKDKEYDWSKAVPYIDKDGYVRLSIWNAYAKDENGQPDPKANPISEAIEISAKDTVEATFTVKKKGNNGGNSTPTPKPPVTQDTKKTDGLAKGKTFSAGSLKYKVTKAATITTVTKKKTSGTVQVVGFSTSGKKKTSINVKNTVTRSGVKYNVTSVKSKAFQKSKKLKKATLGSKITSIPTSAFNADKKLTSVKATGVKKIGKSAFKGCVKLNKLTLGKKKLSSVKKGAFKGCKKTIKVSGGSKKVKKANVKKLKKSGYKKFK